MPYQDLEVGMSNEKDEPSVLDKITSFFTSDPDTGGAPEPVSGGRGNVYERPNERNDYLASMLNDQGVVPPPSQPAIPQSFKEFNEASKNIFREVYNPATGEYELADNPPSKFTNNKNDITAGIVSYVPPSWRDFLMVGGQYERSLPQAIADNVIGLDDDVTSAGEAFGQQFNQDELGTLMNMGLGTAEGLYNLVTSPIDTIGGYLGDVKEAGMRDQTNRTADERLADLATVASIIPVTKTASGLGSIATAPARRQAEPFKKMDADNFANMKERGTKDLRSIAEKLLGSDPKYAGVGSPLLAPNPNMAPAAILNANSKKVAEAQKMFAQGASQKEVAEKTGVQRVNYTDYLGDTHTKYFMQLPEFEVDVNKVKEMKNATAEADRKSTIGELIPQVNDDIDYLTTNYGTSTLLSEVPVIMDALDDAIVDGAVGVFRHGGKDGERIVLDPKEIATSIASTINHEVEHAIQSRGDRSLFKMGQGGTDGALNVKLLMLGGKKKNKDGTISEYPGTIPNEVAKITKLLENGKQADGTPLSSSETQALVDYAYALDKAEAFFREKRPFELYERSPVEVLARGAEPNEQLTVQQYGLPRSAPFNPYFPMTLAERLANAEKVLKDKNYNPSRKRQTSYEEMSPYALDYLNAYRPNQMLGAKNYGPTILPAPKK